MRGKGHLTLAVSHMHRINPAYAGKSIAAVLPSQIARDHPRACGEKTAKGCECSVSLGSPPRMRGKD